MSARGRFALHLAGLAIVAALAAFVAVRATAGEQKAGPWTRGFVTAYSTREPLSGCYAPGQHWWQQRLCRTACGVDLDDRKYWVAANPRWGLGCRQVIQVCVKRRCLYA